jgi:hypothetical protein
MRYGEEVLAARGGAGEGGGGAGYLTMDAFTGLSTDPPCNTPRRSANQVARAISANRHLKRDAYRLGHRDFYTTYQER